MGVMQIAQYLPFLLFGLLAGDWVDRLPRRPVLIVADIGRALALVTIPLAAFNGWLSMELLYIVGFAVGTFNLLFEAAYAAFLPMIAPHQPVQGSTARRCVERIYRPTPASHLKWRS
jgi:MFS family permease